jgi:integrase
MNPKNKIQKLTKQTDIADSNFQTLVKQQPTLDDVWDIALTHVLSEHSRRAYKTGLCDFARYLIETIEKTPPKDEQQLLKMATPMLPAVSFQHISNYRDNLRTQGLANSTINNRLAAIHNLFQRLRKLQIIKENPASTTLVSRMKSSHISTTHGLDQDEAELLLYTCAKDESLRGKRDLALIAILIYNGLRRSEVISLNIDEFVFIQSIPIYTLIIKGGKKHTIEIVPEVWKTIVDWIKAADITEGAIFRKIHFSRLKNEKVLKHRLTTSGTYSIIKTRIKESGITKNIHPHSLRHTYATLTMLAGTPMQDVQISMGHKKTETTFRYYRAIEQIGRSPGRALTLNWQDTPKPKKER